MKLLYLGSTALVVFLFGFAGSVKLVPGLSPQTHQEMVSVLILVSHLHRTTKRKKKKKQLFLFPCACAV